MKEKIKYIIIIIIILILMFSVYIFLHSKNNIKEEKQEKTAFVVNKVLSYTSAMAYPVEGANIANLEVDIYQYTDFAIYINNIEGKTISNIYIDDVKILRAPNIGSADVYSKNLNDFAKPQKGEELSKNLEFKISENEPIIVSYVNNVKQKYVISNTSGKIDYDETILKRAKILSSDIKAQISFKINIIDSDTNHYTCEMILDIPVEELIDGQNIIENNENIKFIREEMK